MDSMLDKDFVEVDKQAKLKFIETQIGDHLCSMNRQQLIYRFQFDQKLFFHDYIRTVTNLDANSLIV